MDIDGAHGNGCCTSATGVVNVNVNVSILFVFVCVWVELAAVLHAVQKSWHIS